MQAVIMSNVACGGDAPLLLIAGPCQIESADHALYSASTRQNGGHSRNGLCILNHPTTKQIGHLPTQQGELVWIAGLKF